MTKGTHGVLCLSFSLSEVRRSILVDRIEEVVLLLLHYKDSTQPIILFPGYYRGVLLKNYIYYRNIRRP